MPAYFLKHETLSLEKPPWIDNVKENYKINTVLNLLSNALQMRTITLNKNINH